MYRHMNQYTVIWRHILVMWQYTHSHPGSQDSRWSARGSRGSLARRGWRPSGPGWREAPLRPSPGRAKLQRPGVGRRARRSIWKSTKDVIFSRIDGRLQSFELQLSVTDRRRHLPPFCARLDRCMPLHVRFTVRVDQDIWFFVVCQVVNSRILATFDQSDMFCQNFDLCRDRLVCPSKLMKDGLGFNS
jgi:hypothetical protein